MPALVAALVAAALSGEIPISSTSADAAALFRQGREKLLNLDTPRGERLLRDALAKDPSFPLALAWLGRATGGAEGLKLAERAWAAAGALPEAEKTEIEVLLAERRGDDERARLLKRGLVDLAPKDWTAQFLYAIQAQYDRKSQAAQLYLGRAIALRPDLPGPYNYLAYTYAGQGLLDLAIATERKLIALTPREPNPYDSLGEFLLRTGDLAGADAAFAQSVALAPDNWMAWVGRAYVCFFRDDLRCGLEMARKARAVSTVPLGRLMPPVVEAWAQLAAGSGDDALAAVSALEKAGRQHKDDLLLAWAPLERGELLLELDRPAEARDQLAAARARSAPLAGEDRNRLLRIAAQAEHRAALQLQDEAGAAAALGQLESMAAAAKEDPTLRTALQVERAREKLARGDAEGVLRDLSGCPRTGWSCQLLIEQAQRRAGRIRAANQTLEALAAARVRDGVHRGEDPQYLWARAVALRASRRATDARAPAAAAAP